MSRKMAPVDEQVAALMSGAEFGDPSTARTMERELRELIEEDRPLRVYCGFDPTKVDLHLGHTVTMRKLAQFQQFGHDVTFLIGNFTGLVGDPSDTDKERPMLSADELDANATTYAEQAFRILDGERTTVRRNADWLGELTFADVLRLCQSFTVAQFLERDNFRLRWERHDAIHLSEFMYAIMQAYDAVHLDTDVQVGGSEQLFNLMAGRVLQRQRGRRPQVAITMPILVGTDGHARMSKTSGNYIGIDEPPNDMYGKVMSLPDSAMETFFTLVTPLPADEVTSILEAVEGRTLAAIDAKKRLALEVTASMYTRSDAEQAQVYFEATIQRHEMPEAMQEYALSDGDGSGRLDRVLVAAGLAASGGEVRRLVQQGAVSVNGERATDFAAELRPGDEVKVGRHRFMRVTRAGESQ